MTLSGIKRFFSKNEPINLCSPPHDNGNVRLEDYVTSVGIGALLNSNSAKIDTLLREVKSRFAAFHQLSQEEQEYFQQHLGLISEIFQDLEEVSDLDRSYLDFILSSTASLWEAESPAITQRLLQLLITHHGKVRVSQALSRVFEPSNDPIIEVLDLGPEEFLKVDKEVRSISSYKLKEANSVRLLHEALDFIEAMNAQEYETEDSRWIDFLVNLAANKLAYVKLVCKAPPDAFGRYPINARPTIPTPEGIPRYQVYAEVRNTRRLRLLFLIPERAGEGPPLLLCRGTAKNRHRLPYAGNVLDDIDENIGSASVALSQDIIQFLINDIASLCQTPITICGHSLGGAVASQITSLFGHLKIGADGPPAISHVYMLGAPGVGDHTVERFNSWASEEAPPPKMEAYNHVKDPVWLQGGPYLPGVTVTLIGNSETDPRNGTFLHSNPDLISQYRAKGELLRQEEALGFTAEQELKRAKHHNLARRGIKVLPKKAVIHLEKSVAQKAYSKILLEHLDQMFPEIS